MKSTYTRFICLFLSINICMHIPLRVKNFFQLVGGNQAFLFPLSSFVGRPGTGSHIFMSPIKLGFIFLVDR